MGRASGAHAVDQPGSGPGAAAGGEPEAAYPALHRFGILAWLAAAATFGMILLGAAVVGSGAGLSCAGWPLCHGQLVPALTWPVVVEWSHRLGAIAVTVFSVVAAVAAWRVRAGGPWRAGGALALLLLAVQVVLGAALVDDALAPSLLVVHQGMATLLLCTWVVLAVRAGVEARVGPAAGRA